MMQYYIILAPNTNNWLVTG